MVSDRRWLRQGILLDRPRATSLGNARRRHQSGSASIRPTTAVPAPHFPGLERASARFAAANPLHQSVLLARSRLDRTALDRPGGIPGRAGLRVPRAGLTGTVQAGRAHGRPPSRFARACTFTASRATSLGRRGTWSRMTDYLSFYSGAAFKALRMPRFDLVVTLTTPPIIGLIGTILKRLRGSRHIFWSMDLHPDASMALGRMSPQGRFGRLMYATSGAVYRRADRVVVLGPYMADRIALKQVAAENIVTIPVWSRRDEIYPLPRESNPLRKSLGLEGSFVAMYSGNLGLAHSFDEFLEAARALCATGPTSCFSLWAMDRGSVKSRPRPRFRGTHEHPAARRRAARLAARLAVARRRSLDLDEAGDDRHRRARQALRRDGRRPADRVRRAGTLRARGHDPHTPAAASRFPQAMRRASSHRSRFWPPTRVSPAAWVSAPARRSSPTTNNGSAACGWCELIEETLARPATHVEPASSADRQSSDSGQRPPSIGFQEIQSCEDQQ